MNTYRELMAFLEGYTVDVYSATKQGEPIQPLAEAVEESKFSESYKELITEAIETYCLNNKTYCEDCDSYDCGCYGNHSKAYHKEGMCGFMHCPNDACQQIAFNNTYGVKKQHLIVARDTFGSHNTKGSLPQHYPSLMQHEDPKMEIVKNWNPMAEYNDANTITVPLTKEGVESVSDEKFTEMMLLTPLKKVSEESYHPESQVWVEPEREVKVEENAITVDVTDVEFPEECHITENLPPIVIGQTPNMTRQYHWIDAMTYELMRRIWAELDTHYGIVRDSDNMAYGAHAGAASDDYDPTEEIKILRDLAMLWLESNREGVWLEHVDSDILTALRNLLTMRDTYVNGTVTLAIGTTFSLPSLEDDKIRVMLHSQDGMPPAWLQSHQNFLVPNMTGELGLYREVLQNYYQNLNEATNKLCSPVQSFGNFASTFIERYGPEFAEELAKTTYNSNNDGDEEGSENNE